MEMVDQVSTSERKPKFCPQCGTAIENEVKFCKKCGHALHASIESEPARPVQTNVQPKKTNRTAIAIILILIVAGIFIYNHWRDPLNRIEGTWYSPEWEGYMDIDVVGDDKLRITTYYEGEYEPDDIEMVNILSTNAEKIVTEIDEYTTGHFELKNSSTMYFYLEDEDGYSYDDVIRMVKK
ncbi:zinc ribbon domain-containing protein [Caldibacillus lycopersici]|uniref:Zinc ribbon domain-containing protein n=1 Tax=Perspicuibacillus lycopersici TaxID=1325689 RepID=A0AAE3ISW3_9BACI|nr:zinc ribbon domain-containing protein [Perspicuibacillus lycopersici]MCU9613038.1 zinc ribbon domain-containing protein [Perspicuibacillus lycopersici]